jgi:hypothetical protein
MPHYTVRNVNEAFFVLVKAIHGGQLAAEVRPSRYGEVIRVEQPVIVTYEKPTERVLFSPERDANPFFHLYEALWMLAGRNDVAPVAYYAGRMKEFSDNGRTLNGAYGYRWRHAFHMAPGTPGNGGEAVQTDQLDVIVAHLRANPWSRRAVLNMWNVEDDLLKIGGFGNRVRCVKCHGTGGVPVMRTDDHPDTHESVKCPTCDGTAWVDEAASKDVCCNLNVLFAVEPGMCKACDGRGYHVKTTPQRVADGVTHPQTQRREECPECGGKPHEVPRYLNMTVTNRSNDLTWGMLGANVVHFSFLQEYMAARLGLDVGVYNQFTNDLHAYTSRWHPEKWLAPYENCSMHSPPLREKMYRSAPCEGVDLVPLVRDAAKFEEELPRFVERHSCDSMGVDFAEPFLDGVAQPMCVAYHHYKRRDFASAIRAVGTVRATDWRVAGAEWLGRRAAKVLGKGT